MGWADGRESWVLRRLLVVSALVAMAWIALDSRDSGGTAVTEAALPATEPEPEVASAPPVPARSSVTIAVTGELLPHPSIVDYAARFGNARGRSYDFGALFADIAPVVSAADLAICHLEVPVAPPGKPLSGYPNFAIPAEIGDGIRDTGWDRCSTASNHSNDQGSAGIVATLDALDAAGVSHTGMARSLDEAMAPQVADANGVLVGHLSYTWGFNATPPAEHWMANLTDVDRILTEASFARAAGAAVVVVSLHWGNEYDTSGTADQRALAQQLLASPDIDLVVGHGPHVLQPIEQFDGEYAFLSVGNLIANQGGSKPYTYDGVVATVEFTADENGRFRAAPPVVEPTWYDRNAGLVRLANRSNAASAERTRAIIGSYVTAD